MPNFSAAHELNQWKLDPLERAKNGQIELVEHGEVSHFVFTTLGMCVWGWVAVVGLVYIVTRCYWNVIVWPLGGSRGFLLVPFLPSCTLLPGRAYLLLALHLSILVYIFRAYHRRPAEKSSKLASIPNYTP